VEAIEHDAELLHAVGAGDRRIGKPEIFNTDQRPRWMVGGRRMDNVFIERGGDR
jgi:hypothetical protein